MENVPTNQIVRHDVLNAGVLLNANALERAYSQKDNSNFKEIKI